MVTFQTPEIASPKISPLKKTIPLKKKKKMFLCGKNTLYDYHLIHLTDIHRFSLIYFQICITKIVYILHNKMLHLVFPHCVKSASIRSCSGPYFPAFGLNTERCSVSLRIQSEYGKMRTRITPNTDTFHAVPCTG